MLPFPSREANVMFMGDIVPAAPITSKTRFSSTPDSVTVFGVLLGRLPDIDIVPVPGPPGRFVMTLAPEVLLRVPTMEFAPTPVLGFGRNTAGLKVITRS
jgi:hypothetical protein